MNQDFRTVTVIIPALNEQRFIGGCLDSILANDYPQDSLEILVVDGLSSDGTRRIVAEYVGEHSRVRMIDNPAKIKPTALNLGIREATGSVIIRMDAHAVYEPDYISKSVKYLDEYGADNVGGIRRTLPSDRSVIARSIAYSVSHPFAVGNATYRTGSKTMKWVDTVFGGCYRRDLFEQIGLFNESLLRGQDREFNIRLARAGGRTLLAPDIVCHYYARGDLEGFLRWVFVGGMTPFYISRIVGRPIFAWRNLVPPFFVLGLLISIVLSIALSPFAWMLAAVVLIYAVSCLAFAIPIASRERDLRFILTMPFIFALTHILYGLGALVGILKPVNSSAQWTEV